MNPRERYLETLLFGRPDHVPLAPGGPRESTLEAWRQQGLHEDVYYLDALGDLLDVPGETFDTVERVPECFRMIPTFEEKILEHKNGHYIVLDWMGAITEISDEYDYTYIRSAKDFVTRKWHKFPVEDRDDWENMKWRFDPHDTRRLPESFVVRCGQLENSPLAVGVSVSGPFWQMREWVGMENLCIMMAQQPDFVEDMAEFWRRFVLATLEMVLRQVRIDVVMVSEDMAFKGHSMISPDMTRRFLQPSYQSWYELLRSYDCPLFDMDSDGHIEELIPIWIESGFNCCNPIEVAAGNDLVAFRRRFGRYMAYHGGIDKRAMAKGGQAMRDEVIRVVPPLFAEGGYIPGCDHGVPPDISWPSFVEYTRLLAQLSGWL